MRQFRGVMQGMDEMPDFSGSVTVVTMVTMKWIPAPPPKESSQPSPSSHGVRQTP